MRRVDNAVIARIMANCAFFIRSPYFSILFYHASDEILPKSRDRNCFRKPPAHSPLSATVGEIRAARLAGSQAARVTKHQQ
jgi:hypothetical protein